MAITRRSFFRALPAAAALTTAAVAGVAAAAPAPGLDLAKHGGDRSVLTLAEIEKLTAEADRFARDLGPPGPPSPPGKVHIKNIYMQFDLRNTDPDRMMVGLMTPIERRASQGL